MEPENLSLNLSTGAQIGIDNLPHKFLIPVFRFPCTSIVQYRSLSEVRGMRVVIVRA